MGINDEKNDLDQPTGRGLKSAIESEVNPWDKNVQNAIMADRRLTPTHVSTFVVETYIERHINEKWMSKLNCTIDYFWLIERIELDATGGSIVAINLTHMTFSGERFELQALIGEGGFAKVYKSLSEDGKTYAIKYEVPSCRWEVYMCEQLRLRLPRTMLPTVMTIRDAYIYANASAIVYQYHPHGSLLVSL
uniref:Protein kinase domain-containing protein n=1 Tax=Parascaris equorum TaxID=6256 RepID=A0A914R3T0_PAREQ